MTWRVGVDVGGTFTDLVATDDLGEMLRFKVATTPRAPEEGLLDALRALLALRPGSGQAAVDAAAIAHLSHASTIATNALLGQVHLELPRVALITTDGFRDVLEIGRQARSAVYDLAVRRPAPLARRADRLTVRERVEHDGSVSLPLDDGDVRNAIATIAARGIRSVAVGLLHSYANDAHERAVVDALRAALPQVAVSASAALVREEREYERFSTAVVNAALLPVVRGYLERLARGVRALGIGAPIFVMQSGGGTAALEVVVDRPAMLVESGPASGVIAAAAVGRALGIADVLSFDMGGTTAKAGTIVNGSPELAYEFEAAGATHSGRAAKGSGYPVRFPFVDLAEVSAGGGTIARLDEVGALRVGPLSAGADPGPACYGTGTEPTVTDANVVLGRLNPIALVGGAFPIDAARSHAAVANVAAPLGGDVVQTAAGIVALVDAEMAKVLRIVSVERGLDPRDFALMAFGGGGPLHACALADELGIPRVIVPRHPGLFSAIGLLEADVRVALSQSLVAPLDGATLMRARRAAEALADEAAASLRAQGVPAHGIVTVVEVDLRYVGQSFDLTVPFAGNDAVMRDAFHARHERRYGYAARDEPVELATVRVTGVGRAGANAVESSEQPRADAARAQIGTRAAWDGERFVEARIYARDELGFGARLVGPAIVEQYDATTWLPSGWSASIDARGNIVAGRSPELRDANAERAELDPITAEIIVSGLAYASEEMGIAVRNAAYSPNIKERLDHSCALFDAELNMIAQAEHIPVHLGSLPWGMRRTLAWIAAEGDAMRPGDQWVVNDPYLSGTHLNDVTVIRPIFVDGVLFGYAANKAHHADVGGMVPGSIPPDARELFAEGFIVPPLRLMADDRVVGSTVALFRANSRTPHTRSGDLRAQLAGNVTGERRVHELIERYGAATVAVATARALEAGERRMRAALRAFPDGVAIVEDVMEDRDGRPTLVLKLRLEKRGDALVLDYTGTSPQVAMPLNAVYGVTLSGVYYAVRALFAADIVMNDGVFRPIEVYVPEGTLLNPRRPAPVSAGNVETSMRNADLVLSALAQLAPERVPAQSGGSMNNVMMGGSDAQGRLWAFYETNGCGMGARPAADGLDAIQAHMTNTLNTPIEVLERAFPLRVVRYELAADTAGAGRFRGGTGLVRALQVRGGAATVSLLAERHAVRPHGSTGGSDGALGRHALVAADGAARELPAKVTFQLAAGETLVVQTAGGGGLGDPSLRSEEARTRDRDDGIVPIL